ncbi:hypothetical protein [Pseudomonas jinjuensis]|uniref:Uncharacterized protein n=1 Tax=Pseudomonas jinjuensis TaxID=198616 RepID=A0A1H0KQP9_9PSED|nr:hypothetical protein [Pseudomonas jinjuensis]SDO58102.1 hypothetical protein SAMN05216193_11319 [Pseudomonas jinjuensis]
MKQHLSFPVGRITVRGYPPIPRAAESADNAERYSPYTCLEAQA